MDGAYVYDLLTARESPLSFNLSDGSHTIIASAFHLGSACVTFTIDTTPPKVSVSSPENKTYNMFDVPLIFTVNELASQITYSLDGQDNVTVAGNTTLTGLSAGEYNVTVYAKDLVGNVGTSETIHFNIAEEPEPFPTLFVATVTVSALVLVSAGLLIYFKKRKRSRQNNKRHDRRVQSQVHSGSSRRISDHCQIRRVCSLWTIVCHDIPQR